SSCPAGRRLIAVTNSPTHPAKASGCRENELGSGKKRERKENRIDGRIASPTAFGGRTVDAVDNARPANVTGIAIANPTRGPDTPMSRRARRFGIGSRMLMNAPSVPSGGTDGRKNGRDAHLEGERERRHDHAVHIKMFRHHGPDRLDLGLRGEHGAGQSSRLDKGARVTGDEHRGATKSRPCRCPRRRTAAPSRGPVPGRGSPDRRRGGTGSRA